MSRSLDNTADRKLLQLEFNNGAGRGFMKGQEASTTGVRHRDERMLGEELEDGIGVSLCWPAREKCCQFAQRILGTSGTGRAGGKGRVRGGVI
jgi:hypothetical protein